MAAWLAPLAAAALAAALLLAAAPAARAKEAGTGRPAGLDAEPDATHWKAVFKLIGLTAHSTPEELGTLSDDLTSQSTEQSLRLQATGQPAFWLDWRVDYLNVLQDLSAAAPPGAVGAERFRYKPWRRDLLAPDPSTQTVRWYHEIDDAFVRVATGPVEAVVGRQPITWGAGRIWQPTDVFGAFSPLALDTEYKPGVDAVLLNTYPSDFSTLQLARVLTPADERDVEDSTALRWRAAVGDESELTLLAGRVRGEQVGGGSFETVLWQAGWRLEALASREEGEDSSKVFAIAGMDYGFSDGTVFVLELYHNDRGAASEADLPAVLASPAYAEGRLPQLSRTVLAASANREFLGLWTGTYTLFAAALRNAAGERRASLLHQLTFTYSISDEAQAVFSLFSGNGKGTRPDGTPQSEFGHLPTALYVSMQFVL